MTQDLAIGVFDSGVGGLTVLKALVQRFPKARFYYLADLAHVPYGNKTKEQLLQYSLQISAFLIDKGITHLVVACHTASTTVLDELRSCIDVPITGMIEATAAAISQQIEKDTIALLATPATIASNFYQNLFKNMFPRSKLYPVACERFVPLIEQGHLQTKCMQDAVDETLCSLKATQIDIALLGSTHFPLIRSFIRKALGEAVSLVDPANCLAEILFEQLKNKYSLSSGSSYIEFYTTHISSFFISFVHELFPNAPIFPAYLNPVFT